MQFRYSKILTLSASPLLDTQIARLSISRDNSKPFCLVCFTLPETPIKTLCSYFYCSSCLILQCMSANSFLLRCLRESAVCGSQITLTNVKKVLSRTKYNTLLQTSLTSYLCRQTTKFQYCSTPDCNHFYRILYTKKPQTFDCNGCLSSICTSCHQNPYNRLTCEANKALTKAALEGEKKLAE